MQKIVRSLVLTTLVVVLSGCAATVKRGASEPALAPMPASAPTKLVLNVTGSADSLSSGDWDDFKSEWKEKFAENAEAAQIRFEMQEGPAKPTGEHGVLLTVNVKEYRFMRPATRFIVGVFAGNAYIDATLDYRSLATGQSFGSQTVNTSSSAWQGVLSPMTNKQVNAIAVDALAQIKASSR